MEILLKDIVIIFLLSMVVLFICHRLKVPTIVGFLITGLLLGPHGLGLIAAGKEVKDLAEIGVVMLLFTIGIEFSLKDLIRIKRAVLMGGSLQVLLTLAATFFFARHFAYGLGGSVFAGFLVALSSTAIVLKLLQDRAEIESPHGQTTLGILIYQDIVIVPMILLTPLLAGKADGLGTSLPLLLAKAIGIIVLVILSAEYIVPKVLYQIARTRSRELFLLSIVVMCLAVAWLTHSLGLSLALGAFLAGLTISESEYSHQALSNVLPFRDLFTSFFFISIGMLLDIRFLFEKPSLVFFLALGVLLAKSLLGMVTTLVLGLPLRTAILVGLGLCQVGEFSFILAEEGLKYDLLGGDIFQLFLAVSVLTMAATPFIIILGDRIVEAVLHFPLPQKLKSGLYPLQGLTDSKKKVQLKGHLIVVGYGINGKNVTRAARLASVPYLIIEMNPETVRIEKKKGEPIYYGDAGQEAVLNHANIRQARIIVLVISDPAATRKIARTARNLNPGVHIIARTRFLQEMEPLYQLGVNEVIPEEFETSVEIFSRVLTRYHIPRNEIDRFVTEMRTDGYEMFRRLPQHGTAFCDLQSYIPDVQINTVRVGQASPFIGKTLSEVELRKKYGVTLLAIRRDKETVSNPDADTKIEANDIWIILAPPDKFAQITAVLS
ncbi:MAG: cation:proton antiporter [Deltaproteobacteria bacterium]|nr:MAG: cation:proton antiporter [Deltaproteobacteria bacterium]